MGKADGFSADSFQSQIKNLKSEMPSVAPPELDADGLAGLDLRADRRGLTHGAALAARFELEAELRADACRVADAATAQVRHQQRALARLGVDDLADLAALYRAALDLRQPHRLGAAALAPFARVARVAPSRRRGRGGELAGGRFRFVHVVRHHVEVRQDLIRDLAEDRRGHGAALVRADRLV